MMRAGLLVSLTLLVACAAAPPDRPETGEGADDGAGPLKLSPSLPTAAPLAPCSAAWYAHVEHRVGIADTQGHGPDPGSREWKLALEYQLGVRDDEGFPDPASAAWCERIDALLPDHAPP